jgi:hypothetical protein
LPAAPEDWRRTGQERTLLGVTLERRDYEPYRPGWDHEHCSFCWAKFVPPGVESGDPKALARGYVTQDDQWICDRCFADFRDEFEWTVRETGGG